MGNFDRLRDWAVNNQDMLIRKGSVIMCIVMLAVGLIYAVSLARQLGWF